VNKTLKRSRLVVAAFALIVLAGCAASNQRKTLADTSLKTAIRITRLNPRFEQLVARDAVVEKIAEGFAWVEGPVWNHKENYLLFSDVANNSILKWKTGEGAKVFLKTSGYTGAKPFEGREPGSNGLAFDSQGRLVFCQHGDRSISRLEKYGSRTTLVDRYHGKRINSPNDLVFKSDGDLYFTDPPFGLPKSFDDPARELDFCGVYRLSKTGKLTLLSKEALAPNGIAFSPDEKTLYVSDSKRALWLAFDVKADGSLSKSRVLFDGAGAGEGKPGVADGMKIDELGNIFGRRAEAPSAFAYRTDTNRGR